MYQKSFKQILMALSAGLSVLALGSGGALANPEDGVVRAGDATITATGKKLDIYQSSQKAVIDWRTFNIQADEHTEFHQPSASAFTLNRVTTNDPSRIDGMLTANGNIAVINPNGVYFGGGAKVDVGGMIATTADIDNDDFMNGRMDFNKAGQADAQVINDGRITAREAGLVGLVAPRVENNGVIEARLGKVALASGDTFVMDMAGDGFISVAVDENQVRSIQQSAKNTGRISADGGHIAMTAAAARDTVDSLITNKGVIQANSVGMKNGKIVLGGSGSNRTAKTGTATALNEGTITAKGTQAGEKGGSVEILADHVGAMDNSTIDVSGDAGGGSIKLGGAYQGGGDTQAASMTYVANTATIDASAKSTGNGGDVIVWADDTTRYAGSIKAEGGAQSGDGGFVEVSGKADLNFIGGVSTRAVNGNNGTLLLDPTNIVISNGADTNVNGATPFSPNLDDGPSILNVTTLQNALALGNVTVQTRATGSQAGDITVSNAVTWGANTLTLDAHNSILINAAMTGPNLTLNLDGDLALNAALSGAGALTITPKTNSTTIGLAGAAGTINLSTADLNNITNGWSSINIGSTTGTGNIALNAYTWQDNLNITTNTGIVSIDGAQAFGTNSLRIRTDNDVALNAALGGTGTFRLYKNSIASLGLGDGAAGTISLSNAELARLSNGWALLEFYAGDMDVRAYTWFDSLSLTGDVGVITINGDQTITAGQALTIASDANPVLNANLIGTGTLTLSGTQDSTTIGLAGAAGTFNLDAAELGRITNGWGQINIGKTTATAALSAGANMWNDNLALRTGTGLLSINGAQTMGANGLSLSTNNINIGANLIGSGSLVLIPATPAATTVGIADGATGTFNLTTAELNFIQDGWANINFGTSTTALSQVVDLRAHSWLDSVNFWGVASNVMNVNGAQNINANTMTFTANVMNLAAAITGTGNLNIRAYSDTQAVGVGDGASGALNLTNAELDQIAATLGTVTIGNNWTGSGTGLMDVRAYNWKTNTDLRNTAGITINGAQTMAAGKNLAITTNANPSILAALTGTGTLTVQNQNGLSSIGLGGAAGTVNLDATELGFITDGWNSIIMGNTASTGGLNLNAASWNDNLTLRSGTGIITIAGDQNMGANNLTFLTDANPAINANLIGSGTLRFENSNMASSLGLGDGQAGTIHISNAEQGRITDGWSLLEFYTVSGGAGAISVGALSWLDSVALSGSAPTTIAGNQNLNNNNLSFLSADINLNAALTGTGSLLFQTGGIGSTISVGATGGNLALTAAEIANITNGWADITIGRTDGTGAITVAALTWNDNLTLRTASGVVTFSGAQNMAGGSNLTVATDADPVINAALSGTGTLTFQGSAAGTTIGIGGGAGALNLSAADLNNITDGWAGIVIGSTTGTGAMTLNARTWNDNLTLQTNTGTITVNGAQNVGANNLSILTSVDPVINAALTGAGLFSLGQQSGATMGLAGGAGTINMSVAELNFITDGWASTQFQSGNMDVGAYTWRDNLILRTGGGVVTLSGAQNLGTNNVTFQTNADVAINAALTGTGTVTFQGASAATTIGVGGAAGTINLSTADLANITNGWAGIVIGSTTGTGAITLDAATWNDFLTLQSLTGPISINGAQTMGTNNLTISTDADPTIGAAVTTTGTITLKGQSAVTTIGLGGGTGTLNLDDTELGRISAGTLIIGDAVAGIGDVDLDSWNLSTKTHAVEVYGNDIDIGGLTLGTGNFTAYAKDNGVDVGDLILSGNITKALAGTSTLLLKADSTIANVYDGTYYNGIQSPGISSSVGKLNVQIHSDANAINGGAINFVDTSFISNGGDIYFGGGLDLLTGYAQGIAGYNGGQGIFITQNVNAGDGNIYIRGNGDGTSTGIRLAEAGTGPNVFQTTSGNIFIRSNGILNVYGGTLTTTTGNVDIATQVLYTNGGSIIRSTGSGNVIMNLTGRYGSADNSVIGDASMTGNIYLNQNSSDCCELNMRTQGDIYIATLTPSRSIGLGGGAGNMSLSDSLLSGITMARKVIIGNAATGTGDINVQTWDLSARSYDVELYGNDITLAGLTLGTGNFMAYAKDNGGDVADLSVTALISKSNAANTLLDLRADSNIIVTNAITANGAGKLDTVLNADRNADQSGAISITNAAITTNGGFAVLGGGSGLLWGTDGIQGTADDATSTGADRIAAWGNAAYANGIYINNGDFSTGTGAIILNGHGFNNNAASGQNGVLLNNGASLLSTSGVIALKGIGGNGVTDNNGLALYSSTIDTTSSDITLYGEGGTYASGTNENSGISSDAIIRTTTGNIKLNGRRGTGANNGGLRGLGTIQSLGSGNITLTSETGELGIFSGSVGHSSMTGDISVITDNFCCGITAQTQGSFIFKRYTPAYDISIGGTSFNNVLANKVIIGDSAMGTGDITLTNWDMSTRGYGVEVYGNDITIAGMTLGTSNFMAYAKDNGGDVGDLSVTALISKNSAANTLLDLRADENINVGNGGYSNMITASGTGRLDVILNSDRDADHQGRISVSNSGITTNGGGMTLGGGTNPTTMFAYGTPGAFSGISLVNDGIFLGGGNLIANGHGYDIGGGFGSTGINAGFLLIQATSGNITLNGTSGIGTNDNLGISLNAGGSPAIETTSGTITLNGISQGTTTGNIGVSSVIPITTTSGNIIINGTGANGADGINLYGIIGGASTTGAITLTTPNSPITLSGATSFGGNTTISAGTSTITTASTLAVGAHDITFTADDVVLGGNVSGTGVLTLQPSSTNRIVNLNYGAADGTNFNLSAAEIGRLVDGWSTINIGRTNGAVDTNIGLSSWSDSVNFYNGRKLVQGALTGTGNGSFTFLGTTNVDILGNITTAGGAIDLSAPVYVYFAFNPTLSSNGGNVSLQQILTNAGSSSATINSVGGNINIDAIYNNGSAAGQTLAFNAGAGNVSFGSTVNTLANISVSGNAISSNGAWGATTPIGNVSLTSVSALSLPSITASSIMAQTTGATSDITIGAGRTLTASGAGNALTLAAGRNFINNSGVSALSTPAGRWLVYSTDPAADTIGSLAYDFRRFSCTYGGSCPTLGTGNGVLYSMTPTLTATPDAVTITYGDAPSLTGYAYTLSGYLGSDAAADNVTGSINGSSTYAQFDNVGTYNIDYATGALASAMGYGVTYANNATALTVNQRALSVTTDAKSKIYTDPDPVFTGSNDLIAYDAALVSFNYAPVGYAGLAGVYQIEASATDPSSRLGNYIRTNTYNNLTVTGSAPPVIPPTPTGPSNDDIVRILTEPLNAEIQSPSVVLIDQNQRPDGALVLSQAGFTNDWFYIIEDLLAIHPDLKAQLLVSYDDTDERDE